MISPHESPSDEVMDDHDGECYDRGDFGELSRDQAHLRVRHHQQIQRQQYHQQHQQMQQTQQYQQQPIRQQRESHELTTKQQYSNQMQQPPQMPYRSNTNDTATSTSQQHLQQQQHQQQQQHTPISNEKNQSPPDWHQLQRNRLYQKKFAARYQNPSPRNNPNSIPIASATTASTTRTIQPDYRSSRSKPPNVGPSIRSNST